MRIKDNPTLIRDMETEAVLGDSQSYDRFINKAKIKKKEERMMRRIFFELKDIKDRLIVLEKRMESLDE